MFLNLLCCVGKNNGLLIVNIQDMKREMNMIFLIMITSNLINRVIVDRLQYLGIRQSSTTSMKFNFSDHDEVVTRR